MSGVPNTCFAESTLISRTAISSDFWICDRVRRRDASSGGCGRCAAIGQGDLHQLSASSAASGARGDGRPDLLAAASQLHHSGLSARRSTLRFAGRSPCSCESSFYSQIQYIGQQTVATLSAFNNVKCWRPMCGSQGQFGNRDDHASSSSLSQVLV